MRFVNGVPTSWDLNTASVKLSGGIGATAFSPNNRLIAVAPFTSGGTQIFDAVTLDRVSTTSPMPQVAGSLGFLAFSPDGRLLTLYRARPRCIINWDLQTGGLTSNIETDGYVGRCKGITYSGCGTFVGILFQDDDGSFTICTYDILVGTSISLHSSKGQAIEIWTHDDRLRFTTLEQAVFTIWEAEFALRQQPTAVQSISAPDNFDPKGFFLFHYTLSRLAFIVSQTVLVWDTQDSRLLLNSPVDSEGGGMSFSPDGRFFAYKMPIGSTICIWKDSPAGYKLHRQLMPDATHTEAPLFSPHGEFILAPSGLTVLQVWHTEVPTTSLPSFSTTVPHWLSNNFVLGFSPDEASAVIARSGSETIMVLDLKLGVPRSIINASMPVYGVRVVENTISGVCPGSVFTWDIAGRKGVVGRVASDDGSCTTTFECPNQLQAAEISPDFRCFAAVTGNLGSPSYVAVHDTTTGKSLMSTYANGTILWFSPNGDDLWCAPNVGPVQWWKIVKDRKSRIARLERQAPTKDPPKRLPWNSARDYEVTEDGWVLGPGRRRLVWLPRRWRLDEFSRRWSGHYLALLHRALSEAVVLDLQQE